MLIGFVQIADHALPVLPRVAGAFRGVRAGSLDDTSWLRPTAHIWTRSKQPWVVLPDGDRQFETQPDDIAGFLAGARASG
jgi:hypothetical protein